MKLDAPPPDPRALELDRLLDRLRTAAGRVAVTRAAEDLVRGGFALPDDDQVVHLQLLEHSDESRVRDAIDRLDAILVDAPPQRVAVLESRLRRLEALAEDHATRASATALRRRVLGRGSGSGVD